MQSELKSFAAVFYFSADLKLAVLHTEYMSGSCPKLLSPWNLKVAK